MQSSLRKQRFDFVQRRLLIERRTCKRLVPVRQTLCLIQPAGDDERTTTKVYNLSCKGIAVGSDCAYAPGTLLHALLVNDAHTFSLTVDLNVVRSIRMDDRYLIAGLFARPLLHAEVVPFLV